MNPRPALREFGIIVAGVLVALAAQALWETRQERERERDYLRQMLADTRANEQRLDEAVADESAYTGAARRLAGMLDGLEARPHDDTVAIWVANAFSSSDLQLLTGSYGAVIAAGDLRLIGTDSLRSAIVAYAAALQHVQQMLQMLTQQVLDNSAEMGRAFPYLRRLFYGDTTLLLGVETRFDIQPGDREGAVTLFDLGIASMNRLQQLRGVRAQTVDLRRMLEAELDIVVDTSNIGEHADTTNIGER